MVMFRARPTMLALLVVAAAALAAAESPWPEVPPPPAVDARSVAVVEFAAGEILFASDADLPIPPASLTKLMTMHLAMNAAESGRIGLGDIVTIRREEVSPHIPFGSSLMYLEEGMRVTVDDLLRGMAVVSGNDAAFATARIVGGDTLGFASMMNAEASALGLRSTRFVEPSGLSELNVTTARDMASLARSYMRAHPYALASYNGRYSMEFPRAEVMPPGVPPPPERIVLRNRNDLVLSYDGCDGLKTGFIVESGYNLVATAERDGSRFIAVTLGGVQGSEARERAGQALLDWCFDNWRTVKPRLPDIPSVRTWGGSREYVELRPAGPAEFTVPLRYADSVTARLEAMDETDAPLAAGTRLGRIVFTSGDTVLRRIDLVAAEASPLGNIFVRIRDAVVRFFRKLFSPRG